MPLLRSQNPKVPRGTPVFGPSQSPHCKAQHSTSVYLSRTQLRAGPPELMHRSPSWGLSPTKPICLCFGPGVKCAIAALSDTLRQKPTQILPLHIIPWLIRSQILCLELVLDIVPWKAYVYCLHMSVLDVTEALLELSLVATKSFRPWHIRSQGSLITSPNKRHLQHFTRQSYSTSVAW